MVVTGEGLGVAAGEGFTIVVALQAGIWSPKSLQHKSLTGANQGNDY